MGVVAWNGAATEVLNVHIDRQVVSLQPRVPQTFDLAFGPAGVRVGLELFTSSMHNWPCSDVFFTNAEKPEPWTAIAGQLSVTIGVASDSDSYPVTFELQNAVFEASDGRRANVGRPLTIFGGGGSYPGA